MSVSITGVTELGVHSVHLHPQGKKQNLFLQNTLY